MTAFFCRWLASLSLVVTALFATLPARSQASAAPLSCEPLERELSAAHAELRRAEDSLEQARARASEVPSLRARAEQAERERDERAEALTSCRASKDDLCASAGELASGVTAGRVNVGGLGSCVDPNVRRALAEQLSGWSNASATLGRLGAFSAGEIDAAPGLGASSGSRVERLVARLFAQGNGSPLVYRRLLIEALRLMAPRSFSTLKSQPGGVERWFLSRAPLEPSLIAEATSGEGEPSEVKSSQGPALATATHLVDSYKLLADCGGPQPAQDCPRAQQLSQLLESSGPLLTRRRIQDVWASECSGLTDDVVKTWLEALPPSRTSEASVESVAQAIRSKLITCFLRDATAPASFPRWLGSKLPSPDATKPNAFAPLVQLQTSWQHDAPIDACLHAARELQSAPAPGRCEISSSTSAAVQAWATSRNRSEARGDFGFELCDRLALALWRGENATVLDAAPAPPTVEEALRRREDEPPTHVARLREACSSRVGTGAAFERGLGELGRLATLLGEPIAQAPWRLTASFEPVESERAEQRGVGTGPWLRSLTNEALSCELLELGAERCAACRQLPEGSHYDCSLAAALETSWTASTRRVLLGALVAVVALLVVLWARSLRRALIAERPWREQVSAYLRRLGLEPELDRFRLILPARLANIRFALPATPAWQRFGRLAVLMRCENGGFQARDVDRAAAAARRQGAELALLVHEDAASPDLGAVRAMLDWAARGAGKSVHILPLMWSRLAWSHDASELLELAEETSLRSNPFEVRGRVTSSAQFFDRERLVSGLLASVQAGRFTVVTGLRRFGKSSLALEVARRLPGPAAYVDLTAFHHEISHTADTAAAADAILRYLCLELLESARARYAAGLPALEVPSGPLDATALAHWMRDFGQAVAALEDGKPPPALMILDELEHAIGGARRLDRALEVLAIVVGRLRNALPAVGPTRGQRVGVLFCSALHPLLWSPLATLAHQSLIGSFEHVAVPCLPDDAASAMMRDLGSRQGIRFTNAALESLVRESQAVPLLLRRLGTAVLELYDPERARQGSLGAVEIGVEGVRAAIDREVSEGSPLRVWVESEIASPESPGGAVLRHLAQEQGVPARDLRRLAATAFQEQFERTGLTLELSAGEARRRAEEAAAVVLRTLGDSGLLQHDGDPTEPEAYRLPDGVIRRILSAEPAPAALPSVSPSVRHEP